MVDKWLNIRWPSEVGSKWWRWREPAECYIISDWVRLRLLLRKRQEAREVGKDVRLIMGVVTVVKRESEWKRVMRWLW
jgi:hypothetical protein